MDYYVRPHIKDEIPDRVIIHVGTNNLTKKRYQTEMEVVNEILTIVNTCRKGGINDIFVSALTCRPSYQNKVENINTLLKRYASINNYTYIDNSNIMQEHLRGDNLHLKEVGIIKLAKNFLYYLNKPSIFESIWD